MTLDEWRLMLWMNSLGEEHEVIAEEVHEKWKKLRYKNLAVSDSTLALLLSLRKKYQLAIITNGPSKSQWEKIKELGLEDYFDCIVVSGDFGYEKPDPKIFHKVCSCLGVNSTECLLVGDKLETDIKGAFAANIGLSVWIPLEEQDNEILNNPVPKPHYVIKNIGEIVEVLSRPFVSTTSHKTLQNKKRNSVVDEVLPSFSSQAQTISYTEE